MKPIKLQIGCTYYLRVKPIGTDGKAILPQTITNAVFKVAGARTVYPHTIDGAFFCLTLPATEIEGVYDLFLEGNIGTDAYSYAWNDLWERTKYSDAIEYSTYHTCCVIVGYSDAELEAAKQAAEQARQDYLQAAAEAEAAKADYIAKAEQLEGVAQETTSQSILRKLDSISIDLTPVLNKLNELKTWLGGKFTELQAWIETKLGTVAKEQTLNQQSQAIKNKIDAIDIDTSTLATLQNQRKMMAAFNMADEMPELVAMTDTEIQDTCDEIWDAVFGTQNNQ